ncbi:MAG: ribosomal protein [Firmicutes bacterium]|nr:ribosomal protein [Bacillota bacterium]
MPNIKSSERSVKTDALRRSQNLSTKSTVRTAIRKVTASVDAGNADESKTLLTNASSVIDKAVAKGVLHKNAAARKKSRLAKKINQINA